MRIKPLKLKKFSTTGFLAYPFTLTLAWMGIFINIALYNTYYSDTFSSIVASLAFFTTICIAWGGACTILMEYFYWSHSVTKDKNTDSFTQYLKKTFVDNY